MKWAGHVAYMGGSRDSYTSHVKGKQLSWTAPGIVPKTHCHQPELQVACMNAPTAIHSGATLNCILCCTNIGIYFQSPSSFGCHRFLAQHWKNDSFHVALANRLPGLNTTPTSHSVWDS